MAACTAVSWHRCSTNPESPVCPLFAQRDAYLEALEAHNARVRQGTKSSTAPHPPDPPAADLHREMSRMQSEYCFHGIGTPDQHAESEPLHSSHHIIASPSKLEEEKHQHLLPVPIAPGVSHHKSRVVCRGHEVHGQRGAQLSPLPPKSHDNSLVPIFFLTRA